MFQLFNRKFIDVQEHYNTSYKIATIGTALIINFTKTFKLKTIEFTLFLPDCKNIIFIKIVRHFPIWRPNRKFTLETPFYYGVFDLKYSFKGFLIL